MVLGAVNVFDELDAVTQSHNVIQCMESQDVNENRRSNARNILHYKSFDCLHCPKKFGTNIQLQAHQCRHFNNSKWECSICGRITSNIKLLIEHSMSHFPHEIKYHCPASKCDKGFFYRSSFKRHFKTHFGYKCVQPTCERRGRRFASRRNLEGHMEIHRRILKFKCDACPNKRFANKSGLNAHKKTKKHTENWRKTQTQNHH